MSSVKNKTIKYQMIFVIISLVMAIRCVGKTLATSLTSALSFSYDYGFVDKSLMGSVYRLVCSIFTDDVYSYKVAFIFSAIVMFIGILCFITMGSLLIRRATEDKQEVVFIILLFFTIFAMSIYTAEDYIGSSESVMLTIMILDVICIVTDKSEVLTKNFAHKVFGHFSVILTLILPIVGTIISSDFVFAFMGTIIVLLVYRYIASNKNARYLITLIVNIVSTLAIYIFFSFNHTTDYEDIIRENAARLSPDFKVKEGLMKFYFYGQAGGFDSLPDTYICILRVLITIILLTPYIIFVAYLYKKVLISSKGSSKRLLYRVMPFGGLLSVPLFFYSNNYGTWFFAIIAYYVISILGLIMMGDEYMYNALSQIIEVIRNRYKWLVLLLIYAVFFTPIDSVKVCQFVDNFIL